MSAFILDPLHIHALVSWAALHAVRYTWQGESRAAAGNEAHMAAAMHAQNLASCRALYDEPPDPEAEALHAFRTGLATALKLAPVEVLKAADCYRYQSCDGTGWETSEACAIFEAIQAKAIRTLPGYAAAPWQLSAPGTHAQGVTV